MMSLTQATELVLERSTQTVSLLRPLNIRRLRTFRPARVLIRDLNP